MTDLTDEQKAERLKSANILLERGVLSSQETYEEYLQTGEIPEKDKIDADLANLIGEKVEQIQEYVQYTMTHKKSLTTADLKKLLTLMVGYPEMQPKDELVENKESVFAQTLFRLYKIRHTSDLITQQALLKTLEKKDQEMKNERSE